MPLVGAGRPRVTRAGGWLPLYFAMPTLVCGSLAFDTIMVFPDQFKKHILADQIHILNVSFMVPAMRREFGGTAATSPTTSSCSARTRSLMATVGHDFAPYATRMENLGLSAATCASCTTSSPPRPSSPPTSRTTRSPPSTRGDELRAQNRIADANGVTLGIVSPDGRDGMIEHARDLAAATSPSSSTRPGPADVLRARAARADRGARALTVNDYEARVVEDKTGARSRRSRATSAR
jgi:adenosine kinase